MISPIETSGMISRTQDISLLRQNEENRGALDHMNIQNRLESKQEENFRTVHEADDSNKSDTHHDAKEKGKNEYFNMRKNSKKKPPAKEDKVIAKSRHGFDIKI